jgi:hypothetical protein
MVMKEYEDKLTEYQLLIDEMINSIKEQNCEIVALRKQLTRFMKAEYRKNMQGEIYEALYPQCITVPHLLYVESDCSGEDPFEDKLYIKQLHSYASGKISDTHPMISLNGFRKV